MKPVLISPKKSISYKWLVALFIVISLFFLWADKLFELFKYIPGKVKFYNDSIYFEYMVLALVSLITAYVLTFFIKTIKQNNEEKITFSINLAVDGSYHYVKAPAKLSSTEFLGLFYRYLCQSKGKEKYSNILEHYLPALEIRRNDEFIRFSSEESLLGGGLRDGDICQIVGKPKKHD